MGRSMKHRIKPVDVSIVSSYMGRFLTAIVTLLVFAITIHAYVTHGGDLAHVEFSIGVTAGEGFLEPLRELVARSTSRRVGIVVGEDKWDSTCELYVLPLVDFLRLRDAMRLRGLFALGAMPNDRAVVVAGGGTTVDPSAIRAGDVLFESPSSANGFWAQLMALSRLGVGTPPGGIDELRFASSGGDGVRIVYLVADGVHRFGACRASNMAGLIERGGLQPGEVTVVLDAPALPEFVVATAESDAAYFARELGELGAVIDDPGSSGWRDTAELLRARGIGSFRPISPALTTELDAVGEFVTARSTGNAAQWDD
jgi:hypothetical protein